MLIRIVYLQSTTNKDDGNLYSATLQILNVTVEDAGKYKVTAKNALGESNATISLNFDSKYPLIWFECLDFFTFPSDYSCPTKSKDLLMNFPYFREHESNCSSVRIHPQNGIR